MSSSPEPTVLIIGAGTFGTSTAYHLAHQYSDPSRITIVDRWSRESPLKDKHAAAIDTNRIIRTDYESSMYCDLANEAIHPWFWSIAVQGHFHKTGWIVLEKEGEKWGDAVKKTFRERGGDYTRDVDVAELGKYDVLKGLGRSENSPKRGYFNPEAGWCDAESATTSFMKVAVDRGVKRVTGEVQALLHDPKNNRIEGVRTTSGDIYKADKVLLAAGAWTSALLAPLEDVLNIAPELHIERQMTAVGRLSAYYTLSESETDSILNSKLPIVVVPGEADIIPPSPPNRTLKINDLRTEVINTVQTSKGRKITKPSSKHQYDIPESVKSRSSSIMSAVLPHFTTTHSPSRWRICYDAVTPTEDWLVARHPHSSLENLYIASGGSFHSYKFLPVAGKYIAKIMNGESCGEEKDKAWRWKSAEELQKRGTKEFGEKDDARERVRWTEGDIAKL